MLFIQSKEYMSDEITKMYYLSKVAYLHMCLQGHMYYNNTVQVDNVV